MSIKQAVLNEINALAAQRTETMAQLHRIDGAEQMAKHLLAKLDDLQKEEAQLVAERQQMAELAKDNPRLREVLSGGGLTPEACERMQAEANGAAELAGGDAAN